MALIGLLLGMELLFVGILWGQLKEAEHELARETHAREIYRISQALVYQLSDYETNLETWIKNRDLHSEEIAQQTSKKMLADMNWLEDNVKDNPGLQKEVEHLANLQESMFKIVSRAKKILGSNVSKMQLLALGQRLKEKADAIRQDWEYSSVNLLKNEEGLLDTFSEVKQRRRHVLSTVVCAGSAGNIILVFVLGFFFVRGISSKLSLMVDNTRLLSEKQSMHNRLEGDDELARLDNSLHDMAESMEEAQKERQAFLAMVSHELRTPLMAVTATFELLSGGVLGELKESALKCSEDSDRKLQVLISRINDLLDLEKLEAGKLSLLKKSFYLELAIDKALEQVEDPRAEKQITINTRETDIELQGDQDRFVQILRILLLNAIQFSMPSSTVSIDFCQTPDQIEIRITDNGSGVADELRDQLFERFRKSADSDALAIKGMGLPIARKLAEAQKGSLAYAPNPSGGSIFSLRFPV